MPTWLTNGAYILGWLLGLFTIFWTVMRGSSGTGSAKIKVFKTDIELQGQSVFQIFLGAVLIVLPVIVGNMSKAQVVPIPSNVPTVDRIDDPKYTAFTFIRDISVLDLRASVSQPILKFIPFIDRGRTN